MTGTDPFLTIMGLIVFGAMFWLGRKGWRQGIKDAETRIAERAAARRRMMLEADAAYLEDLDHLRKNRDQENQS